MDGQHCREWKLLQILCYYLYVQCNKRENDHCCNDMSSMTLNVTVRSLKGKCCQVLQPTKEISVFI